MREATLQVLGDFNIGEVLEVAKQSTLAENAHNHVIIVSGPSALREKNPGKDWVVFEGDYIDDALLTAARAIHKAFPSLELLALDEVGNEVDWKSAQTTTPFVFPKPFFSNKKETIAVDLDVSVIPLIERQAKQHGNSISEEVTEWITERAVQAA